MIIKEPSMFEEQVNFAKKVIAVRDAIILHQLKCTYDLDYRRQNSFGEMYTTYRGFHLMEYTPCVAPKNWIQDDRTLFNTGAALTYIGRKYQEYPVFQETLYTEEQHFQDSLLYSKEALQGMVILNYMHHNPMPLDYKHCDMDTSSKTINKLFWEIK